MIQTDLGSLIRIRITQKERSLRSKVLATRTGHRRQNRGGELIYYFPDARLVVLSKQNLVFACKHGWRVAKHFPILSPLYNSSVPVGCSDLSSMALPVSSRRYVESIPRIAGNKPAVLLYVALALNCQELHPPHLIIASFERNSISFRQNKARISPNELTLKKRLSPASFENCADL